MKKSGLADSPFFSPPPARSESSGTPPVADVKATKKASPKQAPPRSAQAASAAGTEEKPAPPRHRGTTPPRNHETMPPRYHEAIIQEVRKAVREFGKEAATHRFTVAEKKAVADILYTYRQRGLKTSENEVTRIAVNFILRDYEENGENSVLDRALRALNA
jgi:hypothetical protein